MTFVLALVNTVSLCMCVLYCLLVLNVVRNVWPKVTSDLQYILIWLNINIAILKMLDLIEQSVTVVLGK